MSGLEGDTIGGFNTMLKEQQAVEGEAVVTTVLFDDQYELLHDRADIQAIAPISDKDYTVRGSTALFDALGKTIKKIRNAHKHVNEAYRPGKVMFVIITDGHENASKEYSAERVKRRIERQREKYGWEFVFFGANMDAVMEADKLGISADFAQNYSADSMGTSAVFSTMSSISTAYRGGNPIGKASNPASSAKSASLSSILKSGGSLSKLWTW